MVIILIMMNIYFRFKNSYVVKKLLFMARDVLGVHILIKSGDPNIVMLLHGLIKIMRNTLEEK